MREIKIINKTTLNHSYANQTINKRLMATKVSLSLIGSILSVSTLSKALTFLMASTFLVSHVAMAEGLASKAAKTTPDYIRNKTDVVVSNYPLFLLSEAVTKGAPSAKLLLGAGDIGHHSSLSPNDMKVIKDSRYVVWFGDKLETNLAKPFANSHNTISLFDLNAFDRKPLRDVKGQPISDTLDPHIWLDPDNAKAIVRALGAIYSRANPKYKEVYKSNVTAFEKDMNAAVSQQSIADTAPIPYWAYHDAFSYIEPTLNLNMVGALTVDHHLPPKASQIMWLNKHRPQTNMCIVLQSASNTNVLSKLKPVQSTVLTEDMSTAKDFISGWSQMANEIKDCIAATSS